MRGVPEKAWPSGARRLFHPLVRKAPESKRDAVDLVGLREAVPRHLCGLDQGPAARDIWAIGLMNGSEA